MRYATGALQIRRPWRDGKLPDRSDSSDLSDRELGISPTPRIARSC